MLMNRLWWVACVVMLNKVKKLKVEGCVLFGSERQLITELRSVTCHVDAWL